ncbi:stage VI sporulation protein F [Gorillibacterium massiliense]|uniref:stage VI sporulation protein F n=1 Tax=Gorillibacterium massiliense TaxID=1280390 RepID=UPI0004B3D034|nr:stage VI sporulation protein F [Gorillibacterium massiliense]
MSYQNFGISPELVERIKWKMKNPVLKERVKNQLNGVTKADLQNRAKVSWLLNQIAVILGEKLTDREKENAIQFVLAQKIDPNNTFHLIRLWSMFR